MLQDCRLSKQGKTHIICSIIWMLWECWLIIVIVTREASGCVCVGGGGWGQEALMLLESLTLYDGREHLWGWGWTGDRKQKEAAKELVEAGRERKKNEWERVVLLWAWSWICLRRGRVCPFLSLPPHFTLWKNKICPFTLATSVREFCNSIWREGREGI